MSDSSLSSLSEDEAPLRRIRFIRDRNNPFENLDDHDFKLRFRFSKETVMELLHIIGPVIEPATKRNKAITALNQLLITLRFYATGSFQQTIGDLFRVSKPSVCRIVHRVTPLIAGQSRRYIKMPTEQQAINDTVMDFFRIAAFPCVVGAIDCTHVRINSPGGNNAELFRNRKGFFSINVQVVSDANLKIMHITARWAGSVHDSTIFNNSPLVVDLERGLYGNNNYLLGDSGYPCRRYLLTPLLNPQTAAEEAYNAAHIRTRNTVERCFGVLKRRFPCLHIGMALQVQHLLPVIVACSVLHNLAINMNDVEPHEELVDEDDALGINEEVAAAAAIPNQNDAVRRAIINNVFNR